MFITESGNSRSESMCSQDGAASDGFLTPASAPPSDRTSLMYSSLDLQSNDSPDQEGSVCPDPFGPDTFSTPCLQEPSQVPSVALKEQTSADAVPPCPASLCLQDDDDINEEPQERTTATPDVDMLLECTFSYVHAANEEAPGEEPGPRGDSTLQPKEDSVKDFDMDLAEYSIRPLAYTPEPEPELSPSSDEEDIYAHGVSAASVGEDLHTAAVQGTGSNLADQEDVRVHKVDQVKE